MQIRGSVSSVPGYMREYSLARSEDPSETRRDESSIRQRVRGLFRPDFVVLDQRVSVAREQRLAGMTACDLAHEGRVDRVSEQLLEPRGHARGALGGESRGSSFPAGAPRARSTDGSFSFFLLTIRLQATTTVRARLRSGSRPEDRQRTPCGVWGTPAESREILFDIIYLIGGKWLRLGGADLVVQGLLRPLEVEMGDPARHMAELG